MKRSLQFLGVLLAAVFLHIVGVRWIPNWSLFVDLMLVVSLSYAMNGSLAEGMFTGMIAGWATDAVTRSPDGAFGFFGLINTIVGFGAAYAAQRIVIQRTKGAFAFFASASLAQQALFAGLSELLLELPGHPPYAWALVRSIVVGLVGAVAFQARLRTQDRYDLWRRTRKTRIRLNS